MCSLVEYILTEIMQETDINGGETPDRWPVPENIYELLQKELPRMTLIGIPIVKQNSNLDNVKYTREIKRYPLAQAFEGR